MKIFIDCTHTAKHTYKNTGIHRVVRELTSELLKISLNRTDIEIVAVMFNGISIQRVTSLEQQEHSVFVIINKYLELVKINIKIEVILSKIKNKFINLLSDISTLIYWFDSNAVNKENIVLEFEGSTIQPGDIYVIADANWDLPKTYYRFLEALKKHKVTIVAICYDLIPIKFPHFSSKKFTEAFTKFYSEYSTLFDNVLCISKNSVEDYNNAKKEGILANDSTQVVQSFRLGCNYLKHNYDLELENTNLEIKNKLINKKYILVVGSLVPHKNIKAIISAFDLLINSNFEDTYLIFAGNKGWHLETDNLIESNKAYGTLIHILGSVTDVQLDILYKNCYCLVQASFYEGFGLPVVEALQHCKPVIASIGGSLPEVGGDFCIYFDPTQPTELYEALKKLLDSDSYYNHLVERIKNEYRPFSWQESAEQFLYCLYN
ncbi:mannosyl transferase B [Nostoc commune NIES-4072]|uniref:Mannosyl transferase B n=1 Tax=Nostoc commune NIES-4072 TaxID=2005467 RepID=A0A2R5FU31_NOSCO|nr:glycosyltransferase family 1 protein [Nostoc commune]BBD67489.1 mannosyl transferase B [Nostoc commune HK-02]GBG21529.1 mannosyl transferase B [Nostoc commune NIES-4072]